MKIWTETTMKRIIDKIIRQMDDETKKTNIFLFSLIMDIEGSVTDTQDATIYGFKIDDLVPLAWALERNGISPEEVEDWRKELAEVHDWMLREIQEAGERVIKEAMKEN